MATVNVINWKKEKVGSIDLNSEVFEAPVKKEVLYSVVQWQLASRRQGNAQTKTKGLVSGGGIKPFKQKGTGNARQGSIRSPLMPGGGTIFGPEKRSYSFVLPKKMRRLGLSMALSHLVKEGKLMVVENMKSQGKTSEFNKHMKSLGLKKAVLIDATENELTKRAVRNLPTVKYQPVEGMNVYDLLKYDAAVISKDAVAKIVDRCVLGKA